MSRYLQKISLRPYSETEIWTGWELEGRDGEIEGLVLADAMSDDEIAGLGVSEFQKIPAEYLADILPKR
ncbi:MAG TPA: hypothetical protein VG323_07470 [Thermoanaerobaculia bacterium]|nr:hypothetical protein [Thermoanaerobaculia bacterium]